MSADHGSALAHNAYNLHCCTSEITGRTRQQEPSPLASLRCEASSEAVDDQASKQAAFDAGVRAEGLAVIFAHRRTFITGDNARRKATAEPVVSS